MKRALTSILRLEWKDMDQDDIDDVKYDAIARQIHADNCGHKELIDWQKLIDSFVFAKKVSAGQIVDGEKIQKRLSVIQGECEEGCCSDKDVEE